MVIDIERTMDMRKGYTIQEAADKLSISKAAMHKRVLRGTMNAEKIDGKWKVYIDDTTKGYDSQRDKGNDAQTIIDLLKSENAFLREELNRKDTMLMSALNRIPPQLAAPKKGLWKRIKGVRAEKEEK